MHRGVKRWRRGIVLISLAGVAAALSASLVSRHTGAVNAQLGPLQEVLMTKSDLPSDTVLKPENVDRYLETRLVAKRFAPRRHYSSSEQILGLETQVEIPAGTYVSPGQISEAGNENAPRFRNGFRAVELGVVASRSMAGMIEPGSRIDLLVTVERDGGAGITYLAYENIAVLAVAREERKEGDPADPADGASGRMLVTVQVSARTAIHLVAAENFAKQIRALPRPAGDDRRLGSLSVTKSGLRP